MDQDARQDLLQRIRDAGVVGAGGAGFPAHVKYEARVDTVIANGAECEPLVRTDQLLMAGAPREVLRGLRIAMELTGAGRGVVALKKKYAEARAALEEALALAPDDRIGLHLLDDFYPAGDEFVLVRDVLGRVIPEFGLPLQVGAVVSNVSTLADVARAVDAGAPVTRRRVTVAGGVRRPATFAVPLGTPFDALVRAAGGAVDPRPRLVAGGPMMGRLATPQTPVTKTSSMVLVLSEDHPVIQRRLRDPGRQLHLTRAACLKCMMCTEVCPRNLLGHRLYPDRLMRNLAAGVNEDGDAFTGAYLCSECGLCAVYGCVMNLDPCAVNRDLKARLQQAGVERPAPEPGRAERPAGTLRRVPGKRLIARLGVVPYDLPAPEAEYAERVEQLVIPLAQHTGAPARPVVQAGQRVEAGDLVGEIPEGALGARVHASGAGRVKGVTAEAVTIALE